ncbi:MAG: ribosome-associated translation inhibitor RaiA [Polyangiaceae bacterium]|nr:ribosome-associated translation inhibitor RaiA [Polyangiaceae bacterium]
MNISVTFHQMESSESVKGYATEKLGRLQKFLKRPLKASITLSNQHRTHTAEVDVHSGSLHYHARQDSEDMYATLDGVVDKIERQIRTDHEKASKKGGERASQHLLPEDDEDTDTI